MEKISLSELRGWLGALLAFVVLPLFLALLNQDAFSVAIDNIGTRFSVFLSLKALLIVTLGVAIARPTTILALKQYDKTWFIGLLAIVGGLWVMYAMFNYEITLLVANNMLIRVITWLTLIVWFGFLLRMSQLESKVGSVLKFLIVQGMFFVLLEIGIGLVFPQGFSTETIWFTPGPPVEWRGYVGWAGPSNSEALFYSPDELTAYIRTNSNGQRDDEVTVEKPPNTFRIMTIGDSFTWKQEVALEETWHYLLEGLLSTDQQNVEVVAVGAGGWGTDQALEYFIHDGCRYQPDLLLLQVTYNDVWNNHILFESDGSDEIDKPYYELDDDGQLVLKNSPFAHPGVKTGIQYRIINSIRVTSRVALMTIELLKGSNKPVDLNNSVISDNAEFAMPFFITEGDWPEHEKAYEITGALFEELKVEAEACGTQIAAFIVPRIHPPEQLHEMPGFYAEAFPEWTDYTWHYRESEKRLYELADEVGIPTMPYENIVVLYDAHYEEHGDLYDFSWRWAGHFTPLGNQQVAEVLANWLIEERLVTE